MILWEKINLFTCIAENTFTFSKNGMIVCIKNLPHTYTQQQNKNVGARSEINIFHHTGNGE